MFRHTNLQKISKMQNLVDFFFQRIHILHDSIPGIANTSINYVYVCVNQE